MQQSMVELAVSIVTPTFRRTDEVMGLLENISKQSVLPTEVILIDGAAEGEDSTETAVRNLINDYPFRINYIRNKGGTAIQRNRGIEAAQGEFIAFVDDDVRLDPDFLRTVLEVMRTEKEKKVGGVVGYRSNEYFDTNGSERWQWYRRLGLLKVFEPGRYDFESGYPINNSMQPPFSGTRSVDFMTTACAFRVRSRVVKSTVFGDFNALSFLGSACRRSGGEGGATYRN